MYTVLAALLISHMLILTNISTLSYLPTYLDASDNETILSSSKEVVIEHLSTAKPTLRYLSRRCRADQIHTMHAKLYTPH